MAPRIFRKNPFDPNSSHCREEYGNPSHTSYGPHMSSFIPGAVDIQYPSHLEPPFTALGGRPVGYTSPTFQYLAAQAAVLPIASSAPFGISVPSASFCAPPSHHPGLSPTPFGNPPSDYQLEMSSIAPVRRDNQLVSGSMVHPGSHVQPPYTVRTPRQGRTSTGNRPLNMYPGRLVRTRKRTWHCPLCRDPFSRRQDRDRHVPSHLPYWVACSCCPWRGYRVDTFKKHWFGEHESSDDVPGGNGSNLYQELYDPLPLVKKIVRDPTSIGDAEIQAVTLIKKQAVALDKKYLLADPWGHKEKKVSRQYPRFSDSEETNTLPITVTITSPASTFSPVPLTQLWAPAAPVVPSLKEPYIEPGNRQVFPQHYVTGSPVFVPQGRSPSTIQITNDVNTSPSITSRYYDTLFF